MSPSQSNDLSPEIIYLRALTARLSQRIGNPLEWSFIDKGLLFLALYFVANLLLAAALELTLLYGGEALSFLHPGHLRHALQLQWLFVLALPAFAALLATVRRSRPDDRKIVYLIAVPLMLHDAVLSYAVGWASFPGIWGLLALTVVSLVLFFDWIASLIALSIWAAVHIAFRTGESLGTLSYAPLFARLPFSKDGVEPAWSLFSNLYLGFVLLVFLALLIYVVVSWRRSEARVRDLSQLLKNTFGRYVSAEVMAAILHDPRALALGGRRCRVTMLMSDLRGFTSICARLPPEQIVALLNRYLRVMMSICRLYKGTVNDIIGDALLVTFGAPVANPAHAADAIACAIAMQNAMRDVNADNLRDGLPELAVGIGLNTDEVVVGNIGSEERSKFGVIGAGVNLTSRIESHTVGGQILAAASVVEAVGSVLRIDGEFEIQPKGIEQGVRVFDLGGIAGDYHLALTRPASVMLAPLKGVAVTWNSLRAEPGPIKATQAHLVRISADAAEIAPSAGLQRNDDLRVTINGAHPYLAHAPMYAKVIEVTHEVAVLRFTALPLEAASFLSGVMQG